jgi:hypothetical protein
MKTNKEKYDELYTQLEGVCQVFIHTVLPVVPEKYYTISVNYIKHKDGYFVEEKQIKSARYRHGFYSPEKPTRVEIEKLREFLNNLPEFTKDKIFLRWEASNCSGNSDFSKIGVSEGAWTPESLEPKLAQLIEKYSPKEGHIACAYCGHQRKPEELRYDTIISPNWKHQGYKSPPRPYCKDKPCASHDQMAHEG